jgi:hypothetical protein
MLLSRSRICRSGSAIADVRSGCDNRRRNG